MRRYPVLAGLTLLALVAGSIAQAQSAPPAPPKPASQPAPAAAPAAPADAAPPADAPSREEALRVGRITYERTFAANVEGLVSSADPKLAATAGLRERLTTGIQQISDQLGDEVRMISEKVMIVDGAVQYWRESEYSEVPVPITFRIVIGNAGTWRGFTANSETPAGKELLP